jgi:hypothetical protein
MDDVVASIDTHNEKKNHDAIDSSCAAECVDGHHSFLDANKPTSDDATSNPTTFGIGLSTKL